MSIRITQVSYVYGKGSPYEKVALQGINLELHRHEFVGIIGHTGSGKSTLVQHLNGLLTPTTGTVTVDDVSLAGTGAEAKAARRRVGMVFQYPEHQLFEETIAEDIAFGPRNLGWEEDVVQERVRAAMRFVGLPYRQFASRSPFRLSGGQMRRVAIAGVIAMKPDYLVLDEPSAGLDPVGRREIYAQITRLHEEQHTTVILVSHNMEDISRLASRVVVMNRGQVMLDGSPLTIFTQHRDELLEAGLEPPPVSRLLNALNERGWNINESAIEPAEAADNIRARLTHLPAQASAAAKEEHHAR